MGNTNGGKYARMFYKLDYITKKSWDKHKNAIKRYIDILRKENLKWETKALKIEKEKALVRIKKYGITMGQVQKAMEHKGLKNLSSNLA